MLRADASKFMGTGHIMRCLTLARTLKLRAHDPILAINDHRISWLDEEIAQSGIETIRVQEKLLSAEILLQNQPDLVVVDSYWIDANDISALNRIIPVMAIVDGDNRGIDCSLYLDQNLGAEVKWHGKLEGQILAGSEYVLIREEITALRRTVRNDSLPTTPNILVFAGGTDATGIVPRVLSAVDDVDLDFSLTVVTGDVSLAQQLNLSHNTVFSGTTARFSELLDEADLVVAAAGTSSWEICTIGIPSLFLAVVENQEQVISAIETAHCGETVNLTSGNDEDASGISTKLRKLLTDDKHREFLVRNCLKYFDGKGSMRVAEALERLSLKP